MTRRDVVARFVVGTEIYYTGDMANVDGFGRIHAIRPASEWSPLSVDIVMDDGREMLGIWPTNFKLDGDRGGHRFEFADDHRADRARRIEEMRQEYAHLHA